MAEGQRGRRMLWRARQFYATRIRELRLSATARTVKHDRLTYLSFDKLLRLEQTLAALNRQGVAGNFLEFGVALGGSAIIIAQAARKAGRNFEGYDVFGMIPEPKSDKDDEISRTRYTEIANGRSAGIGGDEYYGYRDDLLEFVTQKFARFGMSVDGQVIRLTKGLFEETLPLRPAQPIAFAHIDCDWYDSVRIALEATSRSLTRGGAILLDDYHFYGGCRAATDEFLKEHAD